MVQRLEVLSLWVLSILSILSVLLIEFPCIWRAGFFPKGRESSPLRNNKKNKWVDPGGRLSGPRAPLTFSRRHGQPHPGLWMPAWLQAGSPLFLCLVARTGFWFSLVIGNV